MYCPLCGSELEIHDLPPRPEIDWELEGEELEKQIELNANYPERKECTCPKGCFGKDYPLYFHHPLGGIDTAPGDSWSLSWVK
jgi:hypothetical protein